MKFRERFEGKLPSALIESIEKHAEYHSYSKGHAIVECDQLVTHTYFLLSGSVKVIRPEEGLHVLLYYLDCTEDCVLLFGRHLFPALSQVRIEVEEDANVLALPIQLARTWLTQYPDWMRFVLQSESEHFKKVLARIDQLAFRNLDERLVTYLNERAQLTHSPLINRSHEGIASDLTTSRTVISRLLKKLENEKKLRLYRNRILLLENSWDWNKEPLPDSLPEGGDAFLEKRMTQKV